MVYGIRATELELEMNTESAEPIPMLAMSTESEPIGIPLNNRTHKPSTYFWRQSTDASQDQPLFSCKVEYNDRIQESWKDLLK